MAVILQPSGRCLCRENTERRQTKRPAGTAATKFDFVINLKTARTVGLNGAVAIADEVID
jgi:hypothetical protein